MKKQGLFKAFLDNPKRIGTMAPSSKLLAEKLSKPIEKNNFKNIVEFGAGTGPITKKILQKMDSSARLLCFELDPRLAAHLRREFNDTRMKIIEDTAESLPEHIEEKSDCIISTLPLATMPKETSLNILKTAKKCLEKDGMYLQIQYSLLNKDQIKSVFPNTKVSFFAGNFPPAFIYTSKNE